jgi:hypothetical protein
MNWRGFSKEEAQMSKKPHEILKSHGHKRNANQNHVKVPPHSC